MFKKGDLLYYGSTGVCMVEDVCCSPYDRNNKQLYYKLSPRSANNDSIIYTPVENSRIIIRPIMTEDEVKSLFERFLEIKPLVVVNEKQRREEYRAVIQSGVPEKIISLLKTIHNRKKKFESEKKRISEADTEMGRIAKSVFLNEVSAVTSRPYDDVDNYTYSLLIQCE